MTERTVVVFIVPSLDEAPHFKEIPATLKAQQEIVGGLIQPIDIPTGRGDHLSVVVNEEGLLLNLPFNCTIGPPGMPLDLVGDLYVARWDAEGEITSLQISDLRTLCDLFDRGPVLDALGAFLRAKT